MGSVGSTGSQGFQGSVGSIGDAYRSVGSVGCYSNGDSAASDAPAEQQDPPLAKELLQAVKADDVEQVTALIEQGADLNHAYAYGLTALHFAALHGARGVAQALLDAGASVCAVTTDGHCMTPRAIAESAGELEIVTLLAKCSEGMPKAVTLMIYDLGVAGGNVVNNMLTAIGTGAFHVGVEVYGTEYSFGYTPSDDVSGIVICPPRQCSQHTFREAVHMGETSLSEKDVERLVKSLAPVWPGSSYDLLTRNCSHFSDTFCRWLAVGPIPDWVLSLSAAGAKIEKDVSAAATAARNTAMIAAARAKSFDQKLGISQNFEMSAEYNLRQLQHLDEQLLISETISVSAEDTQRKLREWDARMKMSETVSMSVDYNGRQLRSWAQSVQNVFRS